MKQPGVGLLLLGTLVALFPRYAPEYLDVLYRIGIIPVVVLQAYHGRGGIGDLSVLMFFIGCGLILLGLIRISHVRRQAGRFLP